MHRSSLEISVSSAPERKLTFQYTKFHSSKFPWALSGKFSRQCFNDTMKDYMERKHVQAIIMNAIVCLLLCPIFISYSLSLVSHSHSNPASSGKAKMKEVPTFAALQQFQVAERVTCHNSGKSLWLDLQANSWHGVVEWQEANVNPFQLTSVKPQLSKHSHFTHDRPLSHNSFFFQSYYMHWM